MKLKYILIIMMLLIPIASAYTEMEWSSDNLTWQNITTTNAHTYVVEETTNGIDCDTLYYLRLKHVYDGGTSAWTYTDKTTDACGESEPMAALAITVFILVCAIGLIALPFFKKKFINNEIINLMMRRACWVIGIYLMMLNAAIMATIASDAGLNLTKEMFRYMWLFGVVGYVLMGFLALRTLLDTLASWKIHKHNKRMGEGDDYE